MTMPENRTTMTRFMNTRNKRFDIPADFNPCANALQEELEEGGTGVEDVFE